MNELYPRLETPQMENRGSLSHRIWQRLLQLPLTSRLLQNYEPSIVGKRWKYCPISRMLLGSLVTENNGIVVLSPEVAASRALRNVETCLMTIHNLSPYLPLEGSYLTSLKQIQAFLLQIRFILNQEFALNPSSISSISLFNTEQFSEINNHLLEEILQVLLEELEIFEQYQHSISSPRIYQLAKSCHLRLMRMMQKLNQNESYQWLHNQPHETKQQAHLSSISIIIQNQLDKDSINTHAIAYLLWQIHDLGLITHNAIMEYLRSFDLSEVQLGSITKQYFTLIHTN